MGDDVVRIWVKRLPQAPSRTIISLLGWKPDGMSEFWFYSFHGAPDTGTSRSRGLSFQQFVDECTPDAPIRVLAPS